MSVPSYRTSTVSDYTIRTHYIHIVFLKPHLHELDARRAMRLSSSKGRIQAFSEARDPIALRYLNNEHNSIVASGSLLAPIIYQLYHLWSSIARFSRIPALFQTTVTVHMQLECSKIMPKGFQQQDSAFVTYRTVLTKINAICQ